MLSSADGGTTRTSSSTDSDGAACSPCSGEPRARTGGSRGDGRARWGAPECDASSISSIGGTAATAAKSAGRAEPCDNLERLPARGIGPSGRALCARFYWIHRLVLVIGRCLIQRCVANERSDTSLSFLKSDNLKKAGQPVLLNLYPRVAYISESQCQAQGPFVGCMNLQIVCQLDE